MSKQSITDITYTATNEQLLKQSYYFRLWMSARNISIPRRTWLDEIANTLRDYKGVICHYNGDIYDVPCVDTVFGDDPDMRWLGYFMQSDFSGQHPKMKSRKIERLRLIDLYFKIQHPDIARHFAR